MLFFRHTPALLALTLGACVGYTGDARDPGQSNDPSSENTGSAGNGTNGNANANGGNATGGTGSSGTTANGTGDADASSSTGGSLDGGASSGGFDSGASSGGGSGATTGATTGATSGATSGGSSGTTTGGSSGTTTGGSSGATSGGSSGTTTGGSSGATTGGSSGATTGGSSGATTGGSSGATTGGSSGATTGGSSGATTGGSSGATTGGSSGATTGGSSGGIEPPSCSGLAAPTIPRLNVQAIATGLTRLVYAVQAPGTSDWYLVQQGGLIRVFRNGALSPTAYFNASSLLGGGLGDYDERGLLGLAFHPDYASNGKAYIMLTTIGAGENDSVDKVVELTRQTDFVASTSTKTILDLPGSRENHNGGTLLFGPDDLLYVGTGDGGGSCSSNQGNAPQDVGSLFGKILRLDVSKPFPHAATGNPFAASGDARVFHYGLRNPFRFSIDDATGDLYIGDVGQYQYEEIDLAPAGSSGLNFGWGRFEASTSPPMSCDTSFALRAGSTHTAPVVAVNRSGSSSFSDYQAIVGGFLYRGAALPALQGKYFFGDYTGSYMGAVTRCQTGVSAARPIRTSCGGDSSSCFNTSSIGTLTAIVEGNDGEMYLVANGNRLLKVIP